MGCAIVKTHRHVLTPAAADKLFGRPTITRDMEMPEGEFFMCGGEMVETCASCATVAMYLCDFPMGKGKTCDAPLCATHALPVNVDRSTMLLSEMTASRAPTLDELTKAQAEVMGDVHYCPGHAGAARSK